MNNFKITSFFFLFPLQAPANLVRLHRLVINTTNNLESSTLTINLKVTNNHFNNSRGRLRVSFKCSLRNSITNHEYNIILSREIISFFPHRDAFRNEKEPFHQKRLIIIIRLNDGRSLSIRMYQSNFFHLKLSRNTRTKKKWKRFNQIGLFDYMVPSHGYISIMSIERHSDMKIDPKINCAFSIKGILIQSNAEKQEAPQKRWKA